MKILFVCVENTGRSQMTEAFAKRLGMSTMSAGTLPAATIHVTTMQDENL
jgi:protein-tyrosine-phosphatase